MDVNTSILIDDLSISSDENESIKDSTTNNITAENDICIKALDYMLF